MEIPKPITEVDVTHAEIATHVREAFRNPDYTNSEYSSSGNNHIANLEFRRAILEDCRVEGMIPGTTVVHRKIAKDKRMDILTWGVIISYVSPLSSTQTWRPIRVKWLSGSFEDCHATDLIILSHVPDKGVLQKRTQSDINPGPV